MNYLLSVDFQWRASAVHGESLQSGIRPDCEMALSDCEHCYVVIGEWCHTPRLLEMLGAAKPKLFKVGRLHRVDPSLGSQ